MDYVLVLVLEPLLSHFVRPPLLLATAIARVLSSLCNYFLNGELVFGECSRRSVLRYYLLVAAIYAVNYGLLALLTVSAIGLPLWVAKLLVELVLYPLSFYLQRKFVFSGGVDR